MTDALPQDSDTALQQVSIALIHLADRQPDNSVLLSHPFRGEQSRS